MNVDIDNFAQIQQLISKQKLIQRSQIISFDLQFAGLKFQGNDRDRSQYFPSEKYQKMSNVARKYCILQVGITFFINENNMIKSYPFNFYVFPRSTIYSEPSISLQAGCVAFNVQNKMDWNRWVQKGITYMKFSQYERIMDIQEKAKNFNELFDFLEDQNKFFINQLIENIYKNQPKSISYSLPLSSFYFMKKIIEKYFEQKDILYMIKTDNNQAIKKQDDFIDFKIVKISKNQRQKNQNIKLEQLFGFTLLFQKIWNSQKPLIGHNILFDILFLYQAFIAALPYDYQLFKQSISTMSSESLKKRIFYDTKLVATHLNWTFDCFGDSTTLEIVYKHFEHQQVNIRLAKGYQRYELDQQILHQAGFDSYLTGWIFYQLKNYAQTKNVQFDQFLGKINLNRSYFTINVSTRQDVISPYIRVFYIPIAKQTQFIPLQYLRKQRSEALKSLRQLLKQQDLVKDVMLHQGMKEVFIEIKQQSKWSLITKILIKAMQNKEIKQIHGINHFIEERRLKEYNQQKKDK